MDLDDEMRQSYNQLMNDLVEQVGETYRAPTQMLNIAVKFETARRKDPRLNALRNMDKIEAKKPKKDCVWSKEQDQQLISLTMFHIRRGADMSTIEPYRDMIDRVPRLRDFQDPNVVRQRLRALSDPNHSAILEDLCGRSTANNDSDRDKAIAVSKSIRASCLDLRKVKRLKLQGFTRRKVISSPTVRSDQQPETTGEDDVDDVQIVQLPALPPPPPISSKKFKKSGNQRASA